MDRRIVKQTLIYTITDAISKGLSFMILPFISFYLLPEELGVAANFDVLQGIVLLIAGLVVVNGLPYFFYDRGKKKFALFVSNLIGVSFIVLFILSILFLLFNAFITEMTQLTLLMQILVVIVAMGTLLSSINTIIYRLEEKPLFFGFLHIAQTILLLLFFYIFIVYMSMGALGKILSSVVACSLMAVFHVILLIKRGYIVLKYDRSSVEEILHFGLPLLPHSISFWLKGGADKLIITAYCGLALNGLYSMALSFGGFYSMASMAFNNAYVPYLQKRLNKITPVTEYQEKKKIVSMNYKLMGGFLLLYFIVVGICYFTITYLLEDRYADSFYFTPWIILSLTINTIYTLVVQFPYAMKKTNGLGIITFTGAVVQITMTFLMVRLLGISGVNYSLVLGSFITMIGVWWYSNKVYPLPWLPILKRNNFRNETESDLL